MSLNRYWNLLAKKMAREATSDELLELQQLIRDNPDLIPAAEQIENLWNLNKNEAEAYDAELAFEYHLNRLKEQGIDLPELETPLKIGSEVKSRTVRRKQLLTGLVLLLLIAATSYLYPRFIKSSTKAEASQKAVSEIATRLGSKTKLLLPDSTVVWLNAGSKLTYNDHYGISNRNTTLTGEAFFDVRKSTIPFIIKANGVQIKVLGTAFNVKSYPNERTTETSLVRGRVEITLDKRPGETYILKPNEKLVVSNETEAPDSQAIKKKDPIVVLSSLTHTLDNTIIETSWINNKLSFQDESFADVAKKMERWFDVKIEIKDEKIADYRLTGTFEGETVSQALEALKITAPFNFSIRQNNITITP